MGLDQSFSAEKVHFPIHWVFPVETQPGWKCGSITDARSRFLSPFPFLRLIILIVFPPFFSLLHPLWEQKWCEKWGNPNFTVEGWCWHSAAIRPEGLISKAVRGTHTKRWNMDKMQEVLTHKKNAGLWNCVHLCHKPINHFINYNPCST